MKQQRHYSLSEADHAGQSLQKDGERKLRAAGSVSDLIPAKTLSLLSGQGETIGDYVYRRKDLIGEGYTSKVYKCRSLRKEGEWALKVIDVKKYSSSSMEMLDNEINILKEIDHPNVVRFVNVYKDASFYYLVTELCPEGDLMEYLTRHGKLCEKEAIAIMAEVIEATKYLFTKGIVHRDIKPANILKTHSHWKLADFGFAIKSQEQIKTRQNVGTPLYMPLQSLQRNLYSPQSDIFSVGVIFYEIMVGLTPWQSRSEKELIRKMSSSPFDIPARYKVTSSVKFLLSKMCQVNRENRMTKEQFMELNVNNFASIIEFSQRLKIQAAQRKPRIFSVGKPEKDSRTKSKQKIQAQYLTTSKTSKNSHKNIAKVETRSKSKSKANDQKLFVTTRSKKQVFSTEKGFQQKLQHKNYEVLLNQLNYCRFMYYLIENASHLQVSWSSRGKVTLAIFKHMLKLIKQLADSKNNWFGLTNWQAYRKSQKYLATVKTLRDYCQKYQRQYLIFLKKADINVIKEVNQKLPEFTSRDPFSISFYKKILGYMTPFIKECSDSVVKFGEDGDKGQAAGKVQGLSSLCRYYRLVQISMKMYENFSYFAGHSSIVVLKDYRESKAGAKDLDVVRWEVRKLNDM